MNNTKPPQKIRIKEGSPEEVKSLYKAIKQKKKEAGEPYTQTDFMEDIYLTDRTMFHLWTTKPQKIKPTKQSIVLMNQLAEREGV